jgi:hypothetical protein
MEVNCNIFEQHYMQNNISFELSKREAMLSTLCHCNIFCLKVMEVGHMWERTNWLHTFLY